METSNDTEIKFCDKSLYCKIRSQKFIPESINPFYVYAKTERNMFDVIHLV